VTLVSTDDQNLQIKLQVQEKRIDLYATMLKERDLMTMKKNNNTREDINSERITLRI
jgi:hypothetical protein